MQYILSEEELAALRESSTEKTYEGELYTALVSAEAIQLVDSSNGINPFGEGYAVFKIDIAHLPDELIGRIKLRPDVRK